MTRKGYDGLKALTTLRAKLDAESFLEVIHEGGYPWRAKCTFNAPATREAIVALRERLNVPLPRAYEQFLLYANGAVLYYDDEYGQWGFHLYGTDDLLLKNKHRQEPYGKDWLAPHLLFAESFGDADLLILDTSQPTSEGNDCRIIDGDSGYLPSTWSAIAPGFGDWLDRLVVAQGAKYWRWYP